MVFANAFADDFGQTDTAGLDKTNENAFAKAVQDEKKKRLN